MKSFCNEQCKNNYAEFEKSVSRVKKPALISVISMVIMIFLGLILTAIHKELGKVVLIAASAGVFVTLCIFPLANPESVKRFGVKKSVWLVRVYGIFMLLWIFITSFGLI
ncbi:MAG: hypothetical protein GX895_06430 [Clostridiales bacterium]|uniref:hypothetical protein n=1 Tax=Clostridium sp. N3C TaxID=1776758 RepID=UPI00092E0A34|nr:hypothetical protein [Clostridium sp. N3C]NLZ48413.1 hypothetical protein [Clostridiales bacterium]SCN21784.1 hypothetical protein N3C_0432 [Clostridium sp. N3C]